MTLQVHHVHTNCELVLWLSTFTTNRVRTEDTGSFTFTCENCIVHSACLQDWSGRKKTCLVYPKRQTLSACQHEISSCEPARCPPKRPRFVDAAVPRTTTNRARVYCRVHLLYYTDTQITWESRQSDIASTVSRVATLSRSSRSTMPAGRSRC